MLRLAAKLDPRHIGQTLARLAVPLALSAAAIAGGAAAAHYYTRHQVVDPPVQVVERGPRLWYPVGQYPALTLPDGEHRAVKSVLNVRDTMHYGDYVWNEQRVPASGDVWVRIDLQRQLLSVFRGGHEIGSAVILYGTDGKPTPTGVFPVLEKRETHVSSLYDASAAAPPTAVSGCRRLSPPYCSTSSRAVTRSRFSRRWENRRYRRDNHPFQPPADARMTNVAHLSEWACHVASSFDIADRQPRAALHAAGHSRRDRSHVEFRRPRIGAA